MIQTTLFPDTFRRIFSLANDEIAAAFEQVADCLETRGNEIQGDSYYRIRAYRKGAQSIRAQEQPVVDIFEAEGTAGLAQIPYIGKRLAASIEELAKTGELSLLARLQVETSPEQLFTKIPGIGPVLAHRLHKELEIDSLAALEQAAYDGTLARLSGFAEGRTMLIRDSAGAMLDRAATRQLHSARSKTTFAPSTTRRLRRPIDRPKTLEQAILPSVDAPSIELLLTVDEQYRYLAKAGQLRMITPRRFNPESKPWLPVMKLQKEGWLFNVLYSNTARAHELGKTHDWVVVYYEKVGEEVSRQGQCTIVTETQGAHRGDRVVRGELAAAS